MSLWLYAKKPNIQAGSLTADGLSCHKLAFVIQLFLFYFVLFHFILFCFQKIHLNVPAIIQSMPYITNIYLEFLLVLILLFLFPFPIFSRHWFSDIVSKKFMQTERHFDIWCRLKGDFPATPVCNSLWQFFFFQFPPAKTIVWKSIECVLIYSYRPEVRETREASTGGKWEAFSTRGSCRGNRRKYKTRLHDNLEPAWYSIL